MITIKNLYFGYFKSKFLYENFSIKVNPGDRVGLIGSNGKGKSTFLRLLNGSLFPISGEITIKGKISSYITSRGLYDKGFSGLQNLHLFCLQNNILLTEDFIEDFISFTDLDHDTLSRPLTTWSLGQVTRLSVFLLTKLSGDILLIDEFIGGGDAVFREKASKKINNVLSNKKIVIFASHDRELVNNICNKIINFDDNLKFDSNDEYSKN